MFNPLMNRALTVAAVAAAYCGVGATSLAAQSPVPAAAHAVACTDTISMAGATPYLVYLQAVVNDTADANFGQMTDLFAQSVAQRVRHLLNARGDTLPSGEPVITWRDLRSRVNPLGITIFRNAPPELRLLRPHDDSVAARMLLDAARTVVADGEGVPWPSGVDADSLIFGLGFVMSPVSQAGAPLTGRTAFPMFSVMYPAETPARIILTSAPLYPETERHIGATGVVIFQFEVDSTGHVVPATIREEWPAKQPRPTGQLLDAYNGFLQSVMRWLPAAEFAPSRLGGCAVPQLVLQPFTFELR
jgi:hypothetical protein